MNHFRNKVFFNRCNVILNSVTSFPCMAFEIDLKAYVLVDNVLRKLLRMPDAHNFPNLFFFFFHFKNVFKSYFFVSSRS